MVRLRGHKDSLERIKWALDKLPKKDNCRAMNKSFFYCTAIEELCFDYSNVELVFLLEKRALESSCEDNGTEKNIVKIYALN